MTCLVDTIQEQPKAVPAISPGCSRERLGPRPLAFHIAQAETAWRARNLRQLANFYRGIKAYRHHPYRRRPADHPILWQQGDCKLHDFGPETGWPLFVIPSLINRAHILDLLPNASVLRYLSARGMRPLLLDWGDDAALNPNLGLEEIILDRIQPALDTLIHITRKRPLLLGYCMGGTLATALACLNPKRLAGLALLATPWQFTDGKKPLFFPSMGKDVLASLTGSVGGAPVDLIQGLSLIHI